ncbi:MAG: hypothetical protein CEE40_11225 [Chloroflexi bacterium B3_Chlor]|nr:MAG: hypothetical protein CEE40_11225 [Chloroflexi bacterium B3_Chlor]
MLRRDLESGGSFDRRFSTRSERNLVLFRASYDAIIQAMPRSDVGKPRRRERGTMTSQPSVGTSASHTALRTLAFLLAPLLISLFFLEALRLYYGQVYLIVWAALFSEPIDLAGLMVALLMLTCFLAAALVPLLHRVTTVRKIALASAIGAAVGRSFLNVGLPFEAEVVASYLTIAFYGLFLPSYLEAHHQTERPRVSNGLLVTGFVLAMACDMAVRALGTTVDLSLRPEWLPVQLALAVLAIVTAFASRARGAPSSDKMDIKPSSSWAGVLILSGFGAVLFLEYNLFAHANTISRSVLVDYDLLAILIPFATVIGLLIPRVRALRGLPAAIVQNVLILFSVASFLWVDGWPSAVLILVAQVCVMLDLRLLFGFVASRSFKWRTSTVAGLALVLSLLLAFALLLVYTFSFAYAYTLDVFRGTEPVPFSVAAVILGLASISAAWKAHQVEITTLHTPWVKESLAALPIILALVAFGLQPTITPQPAEEGPIRVMSYNLHQAFGIDNKLDLEEIFDTIRQADPDIIGFQEADAGRVPSLSVDEVLWLSRRLNMYSAYGPSWGSTYGVAVLSKYPILEHRRYLLTSEEQQRAGLQARIDVRGQDLSFFSLHLGLNVAERDRQLDEVLAYAAQAPRPKVLVGDFNANPDSHEIGRVMAQFGNAFALAGTGSGYTSPADAPQQTIDYVFVSPDIEVLSAEVIPSLGSDHLPVVAQMEIESQ